MSKEQGKLTKLDIAFWCILFSLAIGFDGFIVYDELTCPKQNSYYSLEDSIESTIDNVVHIRNKSGGWQGSGVLLKPNLILTARHVAEDGEDFDITLNDGTVYKANRAITSKMYDLGFIKLDVDVNLPVCTTTIGTIKDCRLGQTVYAIGSPFGDINQNSVTAGIVSSLARKLEDFGCPQSWGWGILWQSDIATYGGNSGCPVYNRAGQLIGIVVGGLSDYECITYCIPSELVTGDCQAIELMFLMDRYQKEQEPEYTDFRTYVLKWFER